MTRETVHVVSHSHWDREWYLPLEEHRMRLVELIDDLLELFEQDSEFKSFHLDGQTIVLDDYLAIRPEKKERLQKLIAQGKLVVGPFYILQDDYLITSEANVRNSLIGHLESKKWGQAPKIGYFPDTFGNMGQAPQILQQSGMDVAFFGRGVKPIGFDNQVLLDDQFQSHFSEMWWEGADGSKVLGILFANWYSNGNEIPVEKEAARVFWEKKLVDVRQYASTKHYLLMNGCDHQPVQKNLSQALQVARELYPEIDFVHSSLEDYVEAVKDQLPDTLSQVTGELTSQETDGWYTLTNTASSRIYLKQANDKASHLLEKVVEPLVVMTQDTYPRDELRYAWKLLLENAPHDSICGCSVDEVHREMETRFAKVAQVGNFLCQRTLERFAQQVDTQGLEGLTFTVFNTAGQTKTQWVEVDLVVDQVDFRDGRLEVHRKAMEDRKLPTYGLFTADQEQLDVRVEDLGVQFDYSLPKDAFRSANFARKIRVGFLAKDLPAFSWQTYQLKPVAAVKEEVPQASFENDFLAIYLNDQDQLEWLDKRTGRVYPDFICFEDTGDVGNEYIFMAPQGAAPIVADLLSFEVQSINPGMKQATLRHRLSIPKEMGPKLEEEQKALVEFRHRKAQRSDELVDMELTTTLTLYDNSPQVLCQTQFVNRCKDHRIRLIVDMGIESDQHLADSIYETVCRPNQPHAYWENPTHPQRHRTFISLQDEENAVMVSSKGLHEYEILDNHQIALTLLRATGELGDWGYFPTPEAQYLRECRLEYALEVHAPEGFYAAIQRAQALQVDLLTKQVPIQSGNLPARHQAVIHPAVADERLSVTALKSLEEADGALIRYYNLSQEVVEVAKAQGLSLLEEPIGILPDRVRGQEIRTEILR